MQCYHFYRAVFKSFRITWEGANDTHRSQAATGQDLCLFYGCIQAQHGLTWCNIQSKTFTGIKDLKWLKAKTGTDMFYDQGNISFSA